MDIRLVIEKGSRRRDVFTMKTPEMVIGRKADCALRIPSSEVSRQHCRLMVEDGFVIVEDLQSANGTMINGQEVKGRQVARPGDRLGVGPITFVVEYEMTQEAVERLAALRQEDLYPELEVVDEGGDRRVAVNTDEPIKMDDDDSDIALPAAVAEEEPVEAEMFEFDNVEGIQLPDAGNFRDFLSGLDKE